MPSFKVMMCFMTLHVLAHVYDAWAIVNKPADVVTAAFNPNVMWHGRNPTVSELLRTLPVWTGIIMTLGYTIGFAITVLNKTNWRSFWLSHKYFFSIATLFYLAHGWRRILEGPQAQFWILPLVLIYVGHLLRKETRACGLSTEVVKCERLTEQFVVREGDIIKLQLTRPRRWSAQAGQFACINVPELS
eukprot:g11059.t1